MNEATKHALMEHELSQLRAENKALRGELERMYKNVERLWNARQFSDEAARKHGLYNLSYADIMARLKGDKHGAH